MKWAEITVECPPESADAICYALSQVGCGGAAIQGQSPVRVRGYLPVSDELTMRVDELRRRLFSLADAGLPPPLAELTLKTVEDEDWEHAWKQYFKPVRIGRRFIIKPSWEFYSPQTDDLVIELDPGMAFGTGGHPTTRLCLAALEDTVKSGDIVADIGTGSGILAIGAARLGAARVFATDIDALPCRIARENVERNRLFDTISVLEPPLFNAAAAGCDVVVANIVANTIVELAPTVAPRLKPGGLFIASGIVEEHAELVSDALKAAQLAPLEVRREEIWVCLIARRTDRPIVSAGLAAAREALPPLQEL
jgi:ribosomal protein L11 methyltransferase